MSVFKASNRTLRAGITVLIVLDLLALAGFAVRRTTTTVRSARPTASSSPAPVSAGPPPVIAPPSSAPLWAPPVAVAVAADSGSSTAPKGSGAPSTSPSAPAKTGIPQVAISAIGKCPVKLATPAEMGGLQSLVPFAPAFGPFSAEAFAAASAYAPELELLGPILAEFPKYIPTIAPLLTPALKLFAEGTDGLFGAIAPVYTPYRTELLSAETKVATALAPFSVKLAGTPVAGCLVDFEAALVGDAKGSNSKHASKATDVSGDVLKSAVLRLIGRE
jgi:hypothetical protein